MVTSNSATGYVAKISMLKLNIGSGMLRLSSCMLRLSLSMHELSLSMLKPMLSLSMLILATYPVAALEGTIRNQNQN